MPIESRHEGERLAPSGPRPWFICLFGAAVLAWWVGPLLWPRGGYAGHYRYFDLELGVVAAVAWLAVAAVALCPSRLRRAFTIRLVTVLGTLLITASVCDVACVVWAVRVARFWYHGLEYAVRDNVPDTVLIWKHRPGLSWHGRKTPDCDPIDFQTDEQGFRNPPGIRQADIVFVGDSVTEAGEVAEESTFVRKTSDLSGRSAVNLGVFGYGPQQELAVLERYGFAYRPRVVVWELTEWNDLIDAELYQARNNPDRWRRPSWRKLYENHSPVVRLLATFFPVRRHHLVDFRRSDGQVDRRAIWPYVDLTTRHPAGLEETRHALATAHDLCRARGIAFVVLLVPDHLRVLAPYLDLKSATERKLYSPPGGLEPVHDLSHAIAAFCRERNCPLIDLADPLRRRAASDNRHLYVKNDTHLGRDGHDEAARAIFGWLSSQDVLARESARNPR
jgi:hypothetical protein